MNGGTNIAAALASAGAVLKAGAGGAAARLLVLLTDGRVDGYQSKEAKARLGEGGGGADATGEFEGGGQAPGGRCMMATAAPPSRRLHPPLPQDMAARLADEQAGVSMWALGVGRGVDRQVGGRGRGERA
jgi:hypothetical protein